MLKKTTAVMLILTILLSLLLSACSEDTSSGDVNNAAVTNGDNIGTAETEAAETTYYDTITIPDYQRERFTVLARNENIGEFYSEGEVGEVVNDAVYKRNQIVADRMNINLQVTGVNGGWNEQTTFIQTVNRSIQSEEDAYQLIAGYMCYMSSTILDGWYQNITELPHVNLDNSWWVQGFNDNMTINGNLYAALGDACWTMLQGAYCGFANVTLLEERNFSSDQLYQDILDGKWTFDYMIELAKDISVDVDGDSKMSAADMYGIGMQYMPVRALTTSFGLDYTTRDSDNLPQIALYGEKFVSACESVYAAVNSDYWYDGHDTKMLMENRLLFFFDVLNTSNTFREMESEFMVVPMPKYDEAQENYRTETLDGTSILMVPVTVKNTDLCGMAMELLNYEAKEQITPAYFETALQTKYARDERSSTLMQLIRDTIYFDFGCVFSNEIGELGKIMEFAMIKNNMASFWEKKQKSYQQGLEDLLEFYSKQ
ncbi:MAG: hypothetical protein IJA85_08230 [Clostridia bacterium]|nr:hypothetical protein [Clostridia bacterium]